MRIRARYRGASSERPDGADHVRDDPDPVDVAGDPGAGARLGEVDPDDVLRVLAGQAHGRHPGVSGEAGGQRGLGGAGGGTVGHLHHGAPAEPPGTGPTGWRHSTSATHSTLRVRSTVASGLAKVTPPPALPPTADPANSRPSGARSALRQITDPLSPPALNSPDNPSISTWSSKVCSPSS